jgi:hypothetical protein
MEEINIDCCSVCSRHSPFEAVCLCCGKFKHHSPKPMYCDLCEKCEMEMMGDAEEPE